MSNNNNNNHFRNNKKNQNWNNKYNNNYNKHFNFPHHNNQYHPNNNNPNINRNPYSFRGNYYPNYNNQDNRQHSNRINNNNKTRPLYNTLGYIFNGTDIKEINLENNNIIETNKLNSIASRPEYDHASPEELRLCDYEKSKTGKVTQFRILNTKNNNNNNNINNNLLNNQRVFNNNELNENNMFDTSNKNEGKPINDFGNVNQGKNLYKNDKDSQMGGNFGNNKINQNSSFNINSIFQDSSNNKNKKNFFFNSPIDDTKSLFNSNNTNPINDNNKSLFGGQYNYNFSKDTFGNTFSNQTTEANKNTNNPFNFLENNQKINKQEQPNFSYLSTNSNHAINTQENKNIMEQAYNYNNDNINNQIYLIADPSKNFLGKQKNQLLEELEQKYENRDIYENYENKDILNNYGTYQDSSNEYNRYFDEFPLDNNYNDNNQIKNFLQNDKVYDKGNSENVKSKVGSIYEEFEKAKIQYLSKNNNNKLYNKQNLISNNNINNNDEINKLNKNDNENEILGRNNDIYQKNINEIDKLINVPLAVNNNLENKEEIIENENNNQNKKIEEQVKSNLPKEYEKNSLNKNQENIIIEKIESYSALPNNNYKENNNNKEKELAPLELVPKLTKEGYKCVPSLVELGRKTKEELTRVKGFKIYNKFGEVEFKEPVNLLGVNLDDEINIEQNLIDTGDKLDYRSIFKLYNFKVEENGLNKYKMNLEKAGGNFVEYKNNEIVWEYNKN